LLSTSLVERPQSNCGISRTLWERSSLTGGVTQRKGGCGGVPEVLREDD